MIDIGPCEKVNNPPILDVLNGNTSKKNPCWIMRQAGRYLPEYRKIRAQQNSFSSFLFSTDDVAEVTLQPLRRFNLDAAIIFSDILVVPIMLGLDVEVKENIGPRLSTVNEPKDIISLEKNYNPHLCEPIYAAIQKVKSCLDPLKALIGFAGAPWTVASYMIEGQTSKTFTKIKSFGYRYPNDFKKFLGLLAEVTANHLKQQILNGADIVKIFDSWAGSVPHGYFKDWVIEPHQKIVTSIKTDFPHIPIISFPKGIAQSSYLEYVHQVPVECVAFDSQLSPSWVAENLQNNKVVQGGLDSSLLIVGGEALIKETIYYLNELSEKPYIFNLGHGILPETPIENVSLMLKTIEEYAL